MKRVLPSALVGWFLNYARKLKHPALFKWICALFLLDLLIPDLVPFVDEILLGLATLFLASWRKSANTSADEDNGQRPEKVIKGTAVKDSDSQIASDHQSRGPSKSGSKKH